MGRKGRDPSKVMVEDVQFKEVPLDRELADSGQDAEMVYSGNACEGTHSS